MTHVRPLTQSKPHRILAMIHNSAPKREKPIKANEEAPFIVAYLTQKRLKAPYNTLIRVVNITARRA